MIQEIIENAVFTPFDATSAKNPYLERQQRDKCDFIGIILDSTTLEDTLYSHENTITRQTLKKYGYEKVEGINTIKGKCRFFVVETSVRSAFVECFLYALKGGYDKVCVMFLQEYENEKEKLLETRQTTMLQSAIECLNPA